MSYTPTSPQELAAYKLRRMLALSDTFQTLCDLDYAGTFARIDSVESARCIPRASVVVQRAAHEQVAGGDRSYTRPVTWLELAVDIAPDESLDDQDRRHKGFDQLFAIYNEIMDLSGVDDEDSTTSHLNIIRSEIQDIDEVPEEMRAAEGNYYWMTVMFEVGDGR